MNIDFFSDIHKDYKDSLNYDGIDIFITRILWIHFIGAILLFILGFYQGSIFYLPLSFPLFTQEILIILVFFLSVIITALRGKPKNHYLFRILIAVAFSLYSYLFIFVSGGAKEMYFHFFVSAAVLAMYLDWRLGWILFVLTTLLLGIGQFLTFGWIIVYGLGIIVTTAICQNQYAIQLKLAEDKAKDEAMLASIGEGMIVIDNHANILKINDAARKILSIEGMQVIGQKIYNSFQKYDIDGNIVPKEQNPGYVILQTGKPLTETFMINRVDRSTHIVAITGNPIVENGKIIGGIMIARDVTKEKEIDRMKTEFISLASHQLRTPLSAIKWFTEMLEAGDAGLLNSGQAEFAKNISESTERMIQLVNALLNISRIEAGRLIIDPMPTDLKELVEGVVADLKPKIEEKKHHLIISVNDKLPKISIDPRLIRQVYLNLLSNAIKYTPKEGDILVVVSKKGDEIISQVSDNGYGIPESQQDKVFEKFFRAENVVKFETEGTGLGLYLVKAIVESSKGKIWFKSGLNKGSTFWFSLPLSGTPPKKGEVTLDS